MGDRTHCWLTVSGVLHGPGDVARLRAALREAGCNGHAFLKGELEPGAVATEDDFHFSEVNYAELDDDLSETLRDLGLEYVWNWNEGDDYGAGVQVQTWFPETSGQESTVDGELFLLLSEIGKPERVAALHAFDRRRDAVLKKGLVYAPSAHALLAYFAGDAEAMERWTAHRAEWAEEEAA